jgi:hypothetical protein
VELVCGARRESNVMATMNKFAKRLLVGLLLGCSLSAQQRPPALLTQLEAEFLNKTFAAKIEFGNANEGVLVGYHIYLVDTEVYPDGRLQYHSTLLEVERGYNENLLARDYQLPSRYLTLSNRTLWGFKVGTVFRVVKVELKDDRVELTLRSSVGDAHAKLKLMMGKNFQKTTTPGAVIDFAGRSIVIARLERAKQLTADYPPLMDRVTALSIPLPADAVATSRLERAQQLREALQAVVSNRTEYAAASKSPAPTDQLTDRVRELDTQIPRLQEAVQKERVGTLKASYDVAQIDAAQLKAGAGIGAAKTLAEWQQQTEALKQWDANVRERARLREQLAAAGESVDPVDTDGELNAIDTRRAALASDRRRLELASLNVEYGNLERRRIALLDAYTRAFGTAGERESAARLIDHLRAMQTNRMAAQQAGAAGAAAQIDVLGREITRIRRQ